MKAIMRDKEELKSSGIEWIGEIPQHWHTENIKYHFDVIAGATPDSKNPEYWDGDITWVTPADYRTEDKYVKCGKRSLSLAGYQACSASLTPKGSIIFSKRAPIGTVALSTTELCTNQGCLACVPKASVNSTYYYYVMSIATEEFELKGSGTTFKEISANNFLNTKLPCLGCEEQQVIANYLDDRCSKIDAIIAEAKASIEEYKELKQAVIYEAVTKGLDKNAKMKDSGIEWLGSIPAQWNLVKTNRIIDNTQNGLTRRDLDKSDGQIVLKLKNINAEGEIDYSDTNRIQLTNDEIEKYRLHNGDLLFVRVNGSRDLVGKCAIFEEKDEAIAYNDHIIRVTLNDYCIPEYVKWYLLCDSGKSEIALKINTAAGQFTISGEGLRAIYMPLPSLNEQREIVEFLNNKTKKIDFIINEKQSLIEDLEAYKKSLIYEVVTGKRKVVA